MLSANARPASPLPAWVSVTGAAFAASLATSIPGLALTLRSFDRPASDLTPLLPELFVAALMAFFGAKQLRAQTLVSSGGSLAPARRQWAGWPLLVGNVFLVACSGVVFDLDLASGSTDSGPAFVVGLLVVLGVTVANALLGVAIARSLAVLARGIAADLSQSSPVGPCVAEGRCAAWLVGAGAVHLVAKGLTGGPVLFAFVAFGAGAVVGIRARRSGRSSRTTGAIALAVLGAVVSVGAQSLYRRRETRADAALRVPRCTYADGLVRGEMPDSDVLARRALQVPGVADVEADVTSAPEALETVVTVFVLPTGGGPLPAVTKETIESALVTVACGEGERGERPRIVVQAPAYAPVVVHAQLKLEPGTDESAIRAAVIGAVRDTFTPRAGSGERIVRRSHTLSLDPPTPRMTGLRGVNYGGDGEKYLGNRLGQLAPNTAPVLADVVVEIAP